MSRSSNACHISHIIKQNARAPGSSAGEDPDMLSRSNSTAGDRLRRAKSTSSHHTVSSGHLRTSTSIDPFVTQHHAEVAAVEAYNRARQLEDSSTRVGRPIITKLQRRRSQTGRTEGSHFEDARLGRRRSTTTRADSKPVQAQRSKQAAPSESMVDSAGEERIVTRKRSVIPPSATSTSAARDFLTVPATAHRTRKAQSVHSDGSPTPRYTSSIARERHSSLQRSSTPNGCTADGYGGNLATLSSFGEPVDNTVRSLASLRPSIRKTQTDEEILAMARDKCLRDFQQSKLRQRKSMFLAPFQKRRTVVAHQSSGDDGFDHALPPFNYATDHATPPLPPLSRPIPGPAEPAFKGEKKSRVLSGTFKGRLKKAFGKPSKISTCMPAQQVEAKHLHYPADLGALHADSGVNNDPFVGFEDAPLAPPNFTSATVGSKESLSRCSDTRSRVTSWTNSTWTGTMGSRAGPSSLPAAQAGATLPRSDSQATLKKTSSFFGRPVINKLRKSSRAQLKTTEESQGLYTALQERLKPTTVTPTADTVLDVAPAAQKCEVPALDSLPSQQQRRTLASRASGYSGHSTRTTTPDLVATKVTVFSPVPEVASPTLASSSPVEHGQRHVDLGNGTPQGDLQRKRATRAPPPSQEQLARRMEKSKNRWKSPLDELSPAVTRSTRAAMMEDNPYELRSLSQFHPQPPVTNDLPHHTKVQVDGHTLRKDMLSPSIYSRATDGASPRPFTPVEPIGTVVTITGREVRSYSISPPKNEDPEPVKPAQTSGQWRRWLSDEMDSFRNGLEGLKLTQTLADGEKGTANGFLSPTRMSEDTNPNRTASRPGSVSPSLGARPPSSSANRPSTGAGNRGRRSSSQASSMMNERYPMIDTGRASCDRSIGSRNNSRQGFRAASRTSTSPPEHSLGLNAGDHAHSRCLARPRQVSGRHSIANIDKMVGSKSALGSQDLTREPVMSGALQPQADVAVAAAAAEKVALHSERRPRVSNKHKSAFELRAKYTNSTTGRTTPLEIHRKTTLHGNNMLEDDTIIGISAGPYASQHALATAARHEEKENAPPSAVDTDRLPALSSSEWLAAGPNKSRRSAPVQPAVKQRSISRYSPIKSAKNDNGRGSPASPGQKLAGEWLEKRSRETTPAFV